MLPFNFTNGNLLCQESLYYSSDYRKMISIISCGGLEKDRLFWVEVRELSSFSTDPPGQLDVPGHDGDPLGVDGAQVGVLKQSNKVSLAGLLKSHDGGALEPQVSLEVLGNLTNKPLEGQLTDEQFSGLLVPRGQG